MDKEAFIKLVKENDGFELVIGYQNDVDYYIGGKGNKYWILKKKGKNSEYYVGTFENDNWTDKYYVSKGNTIVKSETVDSETTINKVIEKVYYYQDKIGTKKPQEVPKDDDVYLHYVFGFGERAWEVSKKYGVTVFFSDINKVEEGYHVRDIYVGSDVDKPKES